MKTYRLIQAEFVKEYNRPLNRGLFAVMLGLAIMPLVLLLGSFASNEIRSFASAQLSFTDALDTGLTLLRLLSPFVVVTLISLSIGSEYAQDTWKVILPLSAARGRVLGAKVIVSYIALLLTCGAALALYALLLKVSGIVLHIAPSHEQVHPARVCGYLTFIAIRALLYMCVSLVFAILTRSIAASIVVPILGIPFMQMISDRTPALAMTLPGVHMQNLEAHLRFGGEDKELRAAFHGIVNPATSASVLLLTCCVLIGLALVLFRRRDIT